MTRVVSAEYERINGVRTIREYAIGTIGATKPDHQGNTLYRVDWDEGGYDWLYAGEFTICEEGDIITAYQRNDLNVRIHHGEVRDMIVCNTIPCIHQIQEHIITRFLSGDLPLPVGYILDRDLEHRHQQSKKNILRGHGEADASYDYNDWERSGYKFTWDILLNTDHTELAVHVFVQKCR